MLNKSEYFEPIDPDEKNDEFIAIESKSFFKDVCERFVKNKRAMIALVIFLIIALMAIFGPMISPYSTSVPAQHTGLEQTDSEETFLQEFFMVQESVLWLVLLQQ